MSTSFRTRWIFRVHVLLLLPALIVAAYLAVDLALHPSMVEAASFVGRIGLVLTALVVGPLTVGVGLFCIQRVPGNVVGPILALWGCGIIEIISTRSIPWIDAHETIYGGIIWPASFYLFSYFPDGRVYPYRFERLVDGMVLFTYAMATLTGLSSEVVLFTSPPGANPVFIPVLEPFSPWFGVGNLVGAVFGLLFCVVSLTLRYRAADARVRQQIKWLLAGLFPFVLLVIPQWLLLQLPAFASLTDVLGNVVAFWLMIFPVVAIGNAMLRHRLYDIDVIIRRTLIYTLLTAALGAIYFSVVVVLQTLLGPLVGENNQVAIVGSTLAIAALFQPLRRRIQAAIDHRFYRRKYDAARIVQAFGDRLRDEVEMDSLTNDLLGVVEETLQPAHTSLWLRQAKRR